MKPKCFFIIFASIAILLIFSLCFSSCTKEEYIATGTIVGSPSLRRGRLSMLVQVDKQYPIGNYFGEYTYTFDMLSAHLGIYHNCIQTQPLYLSDTTITINQRISFSYRKYNPSEDDHLFRFAVTFLPPLNNPIYIITNYQILK